MPNANGSPTFTERFAASLGRGARRIVEAWRQLDTQQKVAAAAAIALILSLALPWFRLTGPDPISGAKTSSTVTGFGCFTFLEGSIVLVAIAVLWMLFARGEERAFHLPCGDGSIVALAGAWCLGLLTWRIVLYPPRDGGFDPKVDWGVMVSMAASALLLGIGLRMRAAHIPEPPIERQFTIDGHLAKPTIPAPTREPEPRDDRPEPTEEQLSIPLDESPPARKRTRRKKSD